VKKGNSFLNQALAQVHVDVDPMEMRNKACNWRRTIEKPSENFTKQQKAGCTKSWNGAGMEK
jgi:hypothetical protein